MSEDESVIRFADVQTFYRAMNGSWRGGYDLWLHPASPKESSESTARITAGTGEALSVMDYQWTREEKGYQGVFHFGGAGKEADFNWTDSFHSATAPMRGEGSLSDDGSRLIFMSSYSGAPGQPKWGWRTEFSFIDSDTFRMEAYNITPQGQEALAVRCDYTKQR